MRKPTRRELFYGWLSGKALVRAGRLAEARGDVHELRHCAAALAAGNNSTRSHAAGECMAITVLDRYARGDLA